MNQRAHRKDCRPRRRCSFRPAALWPRLSRLCSDSVGAPSLSGRASAFLTQGPECRRRDSPKRALDPGLFPACEKIPQRHGQEGRDPQDRRSQTCLTRKRARPARIVGHCQPKRRGGKDDDRHQSRSGPPPPPPRSPKEGHSTSFSVDLDPQGNASTGLGVSSKDRGLYDLRPSPRRRSRREGRSSDRGPKACCWHRRPPT